MSTTRREFMITSIAALAASQLSAGAAAASPHDAAAELVLAEIAEELLTDYPESATMLGIDNGERAGLKSKLADRTAAGQEAVAKRVAARLQRLNALDPKSLGAAAFNNRGQ